jgi:dihydroorotase-like cyclic amidohydrolase
MGIWPRKGAIRAGSDADVAIVGLDSDWTFEPEQLQARSGISPYVGRSFRGEVVRTLVRGITVYDDGEFVEDDRRPRLGRLVTRMGA